MLYGRWPQIVKIAPMAKISFGTHAERISSRSYSLTTCHRDSPVRFLITIIIDPLRNTLLKAFYYYFQTSNEHVIMVVFKLRNTVVI